MNQNNITSTEIKSKLKILETSKFFDSPRTVSETVQQLREYGWATGTLDVSKALAKMSLNKKFTKSLSENKTCYLIEQLPLSR